MADMQVVVSDNGTGAGFAGDNFPRFVFPSMVGTPMLRAEEDISADIELKVTYPVDNGIIKHWDAMEKVWDHTFYEKMNIDCHENKIMLTEAPMNPRANRIRMIETMMEKYGFAELQVSIQAMLTLYAQGLMSGMVVDSGDGVTHIVAVSDGYVQSTVTKRLNLAGRHLTQYLIKLMGLRGYTFNRTADFHTVQQMKEKLCYVALDPAKEARLAEETAVLVERYTLPDGREIRIGRERFFAPEALFNPGLCDVEQDGLSKMVFDAIQRAAPDIRPQLYSHIVLSGGTTMYPGLPSRLEHDLVEQYVAQISKGDRAHLKRQKFKITVEDPPGRKNAVFMGASVLGDLMRNAEGFWTTQEVYAEHGAERVAEMMRTEV